MVLRLVGFSAFTGVLLALPYQVSAQKGSKGGGQCQQGQSQSRQMQTPTGVVAMQQGFTMLKTLVTQIQGMQINNSSSQALKADLQTALAVNQNATLSPQQKEAQLSQVMTQTLADMKALAAESSLTAGQQSALSSAIGQFELLTAVAQQGSQRGAPFKKGPGGPR